MKKLVDINGKFSYTFGKSDGYEREVSTGRIIFSLLDSESQPGNISA